MFLKYYLLKLTIFLSGLVGADGATHHGAFDLSFLACIPNMIIMTPADENECRQMLYTAYRSERPAAVRYPRGGGMAVTPRKEMQCLPLGRGEIRRRGKRIALLAFGSLLRPALAAAEEIDASVANMRFVKPLDADLVRTLADEHELLVTLEENSVIGGAGAEVARVLETLPKAPRLLRLGLPDRFIDHGEQAQLLETVGLDSTGIIAAIERFNRDNS